MLALFLAFQLVLDAVLVSLLLVWARRRRATPPVGRRPSAQTPPQWYREFLLLAEDVLALVEPVLDALESGRLAAPAAAPAAGAARPAPPGSPDLRREALALLRAGAAPEDVARRGHLLPAQARLIQNLAAAQAELGSPRKA